MNKTDLNSTSIYCRKCDVWNWLPSCWAGLTRQKNHRGSVLNGRLASTE